MPERSTRARSHLIGGFAGGLASALTLQPFDLLKTRIQQSKDITLWSAIRQVDSVKSLWRGTLASSIRTSVGSALYLTSLNVMRTALASNRNSGSAVGRSSNLPQLSMYENLLAGVLARALVGYITMPVTVLKVRYESTLYQYRSLTEATKDIYAKEGIKGFFRGFGPTCLRDAPYAGLYVLLYERSKIVVPKLLPKSMIRQDSQGSYTTYTSTIVNALSAVFSASFATTITAPFDTIKTRMQLEPTKFTSFLRTFVVISKEESVLQLFSGLSMRLARKALSAGIAWGIYEELIKKFM